MSIYSMKDLLRRSVTRNGLGQEVTASQIVSCANDFLADILPLYKRSSAQAVSVRAGVLKIQTSSSSVNQHLRSFEQELIDRISEKFQEKKVTKVLYQINHDHS